jgi:hypothetical protein
VIGVIWIAIGFIAMVFPDMLFTILVDWPGNILVGIIVFSFGVIAILTGWLATLWWPGKALYKLGQKN